MFLEWVLIGFKIARVAALKETFVSSSHFSIILLTGSGRKHNKRTSWTFSLSQTHTEILFYSSHSHLGKINCLLILNARLWLLSSYSSDKTWSDYFWVRCVMLLTSNDLSQLDDPDFAPTHNVSHFCFLSQTEGMSQPHGSSREREKAISIFHYLLIPLCCSSCPNFISFSH